MNSLSDGPKAEPITVVLLEDDAPTLWRLQDALTKAGYQVRAAGTLAEARACLAQGAPKVLLTTGYLLKDAFPTDIAATVRDLVAGHSPISASIARFIVRRTQNTPEPPPGPALNTTKLTPREIDILWGIAKGFSYAEIASHLGLSRQTVPGHIKNIYRKLEVHTRGEAVFEAVQQGLIKL
jgi:DNA-binding CsgD family transcriptional regulator